MCPQAAEDRRLLPGGAEVAALPPLKTFRSECVHGSMIGNACFADPSIARSCHSCTHVPILGSCVEAGVFCGFLLSTTEVVFQT